MTDRKELEILRTGVARIAQYLGLYLMVPGRPGTAFEEVAKAAAEHERGWNKLCAEIITHIETQRWVEHDEARAVQERSNVRTDV